MQLEKILELESIESDAISRKLIAKSADGSLRDALSLLDQAIAYGGGHLQEAQVRTMLGTIDSLDLKELLEALISGDAQSVLQCTDHMAEHNPDYDSVLVELLSILQKIAICQVLNSDDVEQDEAIKELSQRISQEDVQLYYQMGILGRKDLPVAPDPRSGFEMTLIRMLAFRPAAVANPDTGDAGGTTNNARKNNTRKNKARAGEVKDNVSFQAEKPLATSKETSIETNTTTQPNADPEGTVNWQSIIDEMALVGLVKELAGHCALKGHSEGKVHLVLSPDKEHLLNQTQKERLSNALEMRFGKGTQLKITVEEPEAETPAQKKAREEREKQQTAESSIKGDANVQAIEEIFGATLDEKSIRPV
ncbi:MAG: hypothetical protein IIA77_11850 [Proteobacteria bacterium]|nr:hypothetical protein [Pseudomonadota bacterium]